MLFRSKKAEISIADSEQKIARIESEITAIEARLATPEGASDASLYEEYGGKKKELSEVMDQWAEQTMELELLNENL